MQEAAETMDDVLNGFGGNIAAGMRAALDYLGSRSTGQLLAHVGRRVESLPRITPVDKTALQDSYGGARTTTPDDMLTGRGLFYVTEQGRLSLDCTSGHYQMLWGYNDPHLCRSAAAAVEAGIVWDNHCNVPQTPVKRLAHRLVELANDSGEPDPLNTVHLGCCTGSVACAAALKIQLVVHEREHGPTGRPAVVVMDGNYHGTDVLCQRLRGMWSRFVHNLDVIAVQPNDHEELEDAFRRAGGRVAAFWAEPILMNREAIVLDAEYLQLARRLCDACGAVMCIDEIQTGFWQPEVFDFRSLGIRPDMVVVGKGMTGGFHPLAAVLYKERLDVLATYDAISTNGSAPLAAYMALCCIERLLADSARIAAVGDRYEQAMRELASEFPDLLVDARGKRHMMGLKFRRVEDALTFHRRGIERGLWIRVHAYHEGHSTVLTKLALPADASVTDYVIETFRDMLRALRSAEDAE